MEYGFDLQGSVSEAVEQTCAGIEQSQVENLEKALVVVPKEPRWI